MCRVMHLDYAIIPLFQPLPCPINACHDIFALWQRAVKLAEDKLTGVTHFLSLPKG